MPSVARALARVVVLAFVRVEAKAPGRVASAREQIGSEAFQLVLFTEVALVEIKEDFALEALVVPAA